MHWLAKYFPHDIASNGRDIDGLFTVIYWITASVFLLVMGLMLLFLIRYRHRPGHKAIYHHGNNTLEIVWTVIPALILVWLTFKSEAVWSQVRGELPPADLRIGVSAEQYNWFFCYPGADGNLGKPVLSGKSAHFSEGDNVVETTLHVPKGKVIRVAITSGDVIHSFFLPNLRLKQDAVPGRIVEVWFKPMETGEYEVACAELCGEGHTGMRAKMVVHEPSDFVRWLKEKTRMRERSNSRLSWKSLLSVLARRRW